MLMSIKQLTWSVIGHTYKWWLDIQLLMTAWTSLSSTLLH